MVAFFICIICYEKGLRNGYNMAKDKQPEQMKSPIATVSTAIHSRKQRKEEEKLTSELEEVFDYTAEKALQAVKR